MAQDGQNGALTEEAVVSHVTFTAVKPWLVVEAPKASDAVKFYKEAFGAEEVSRVNHPKRKADQEHPLVRSAELKLGSYSFVVSDLTEEISSHAKSVSMFCLETDDVVSAVDKAVSAGATADGEIIETEGDGCGGRRVGRLQDPYGNVWQICSPIKTTDEVAA